jgi:hypothetical protein
LLSNNLLAFEQIKRAAVAVLLLLGKPGESHDGGLLASEMMSDSDVISHVQWT